jgi:hypothetical protein
MTTLSCSLAEWQRISLPWTTGIAVIWIMQFGRLAEDIFTMDYSYCSDMTTLSCSLAEWQRISLPWTTGIAVIWLHYHAVWQSGRGYLYHGLQAQQYYFFGACCTVFLNIIYSTRYW